MKRKRKIRTEMYVECSVCEGSGEVVNPTFEGWCKDWFELHPDGTMEEAYCYCPHHHHGRCECGPEIIECPACEGTGWVKVHTKEVVP